MTDLNEWNLHYVSLLGPVLDLNFGFSETSDYPLATQFTISDPERTNADVQHGTDDAVLMGRDLLGGMDLNFAFTTNPDPNDAEQVTTALDMVGSIQAAWRGFQVMKEPGRYAVLTNLFRNRFVLGRPRNFARTQDRMRKGLIQYQGLFRAATPEFYGSLQTLLPVRTVSTEQSITGETLTWPNITFTGKFDTATLAWIPAGFGHAWSITVNHHLDYPVQTEIETRPLFRGATDNGGDSVNGYLTGSPMSDCYLFPGDGGHFTFTTTGTTDVHTACQIQWFPTFLGL